MVEQSPILINVRQGRLAGLVDSKPTHKRRLFLLHAIASQLQWHVCSLVVGVCRRVVS